MAGRKQTSTQNHLIRLDLGCGNAKPFDFIGADRFALPGVDLVLDLDQPLPFADNSIDLILASHSLEHVIDLMATMKEIYRVSKDRAQVCVVAPYSQQSLNSANPYHQQTFNEHTPRFWTAAQETPIDPQEYYHPHAASWGLSESDSGSPGIDFRCIDMEFFYFPEYRHLPAQERRAARKKLLDVCDQIVYHLLVVKSPLAEAEMQETLANIELYEPPQITLRKVTDLLAAWEESVNKPPILVPNRKVEFSSAEIQEAVEYIDGFYRASYATIGRLPGLLAAQTETIYKLRSKLHSHKVELAQTLQAREAELTQTLQAREAELNRALHKLTMLRNQRVYRWLESLASHFSRHNFWHEIAPPFQQLKDDSLIFSDNLRGFRLQPGPNLQSVPFVAYPISLKRPRLKGLLLAPVLEAPLNEGQMGIELVSPQSQIVAQAVVPASEVSERAPVRFDFEPLANTEQGRFWLRVFARDVPGPIRVFEWRKPLLGLGPLQRRAFCGFIFQE